MTSAPTPPPFRGDHVGSLLRPKNLLEARDDHAAGRITLDELRRVEDDAIRDVVRLQEDIGMPAATDGEFRRTSWHMDFIYQLRRHQPHGREDRGALPQRARAISTSPRRR